MRPLTGFFNIEPRQVLNGVPGQPAPEDVTPLTKADLQGVYGITGATLALLVLLTLFYMVHECSRGGLSRHNLMLGHHHPGHAHNKEISV